MDEQLAETILQAAKVGASRWRLVDPAISREDVEQSIAVGLIARSAAGQDLSPALATWLAIHSSRDWVMSPGVRRRQRQVALTDLMASREAVDSCVVQEVIRREAESLISQTPMSRMQRRIIDGMLAGNTPKEIADAMGTSISSVSNALRTAVVAIRKRLGIAAKLPVRLGRCRAASDTAEQQRRCEMCQNDILGKRADARFCSPTCSQKYRRRGRKK